MNDIIHADSTPTVERGNCSVAPVKRLFSVPTLAMLDLFGGSSLTTVSTNELANGKAESTAPSSATSREYSAANSFAKRTRLLIAYGLIAGTTPQSVRKRRGASVTQGDVFARPDGCLPEQQKAD